MVITGVPYREGESLRGIVASLAHEAHRLVLGEGDFWCIRALGKRKTREELESNRKTPKIIVTLATHTLKDRLAP